MKNFREKLKIFGLLQQEPINCKYNQALIKGKKRRNSQKY